LYDRSRGDRFDPPLPCGVLLITQSNVPTSSPRSGASDHHG